MGDHAALPALMGTMEAAGFHDLPATLAALDTAENALGTRFHQSRQAIHRARAAAEAGEWVLCWGSARQATQTLTGPFPPDLSMCAPRPDDTTPFARSAACACGASLSPGVRFCSTCGKPTR